MHDIIAPELTSPRFKANPHPFHARLRAEAPFYRTRLTGRGVAWLVTRYDDVVGVLRDERFGKAARLPALATRTVLARPGATATDIPEVAMVQGGAGG
jgi:cytochrome P450